MEITRSAPLISRTVRSSNTMPVTDSTSSTNRVLFIFQAIDVSFPLSRCCLPKARRARGEDAGCLVKLDGADRDGLVDLGRRLRHLHAQLPGRLRVNCSLLYRAGTSLVIAPARVARPPPPGAPSRALRPSSLDLRLRRGAHAQPLATCRRRSP